MPGTAGDLGIYPAYYDDPWLQVTRRARRYNALAQMLKFMFEWQTFIPRRSRLGYNAGRGNVSRT